MSEVRMSGVQTTPRDETIIRAFYGDNLKVIGASNVDVSPGPQAQFYSADGGANWGQTALPFSNGDTDNTDPAVAWTTDGTAWAMTQGLSASKLRLFKSIDGGQTWTFDSTPSGSDSGLDRPSLWIDQSMTSPHKDSMYVIYQQPGPARVARRTNPTAAWDAPQTVSGAETTGNAVGADIRTNNAGDVFAFWPDTGSRGIYVAKSTNGGGAFGTPVKIATSFASFEFPIPAQAERKAGVYVMGGAYKGATRDIVHACWADLSGDTGCTSGSGPGTDTSSSCKSRIWYSRSINGGGMWSTPTKIHDPSSKNDQFHPALAVDPTNGNVAIIYYDTVNDSGRKKVDVWMQVSNDDGANWSNPTQITSSPTDETVSGADNSTGSWLGDQLGDYIGLDLNAGVAFPAWTDRRNDAREEIWTSTTSIAVKELSFIVDRSTFGEDEVKALVTLSNPAVVSAAFYVVVDGFSANDLGIQASDYSGAPAKKPALTATPFGGMTVGDPTALIPEDASNFTSPQRFTWVYPVSFTDDSGFTAALKIVTLNANISTVSGSAQIRMLQQPNPYELDGDPPWLSTDLRVFSVDEGGSGMFGANLNGNTSADAVQFIKDVISNLNSGNTGGQTFDGNLDPNGAPLAIFEKHLNGKKVFNYAVAKVRYNSLALSAKTVRVFFRLCPALTVSTAYDPNTTYMTYSDNVQFGKKVPLLGTQNNNILTIPFFAEARAQTDNSKPSPVDMTTQSDPSNVQQIDAASGGTGKEVDHYFGCWLDINQPSQTWFPLNPTNNGPFNPPLQSITSLVRNQHQCLIAEIAFDSGDPIPAGATPFTSDKLAQRNLDLVTVANPGEISSRSVPSTFELKPTLANVPPAAADELMIDWGTTPAGSIARIFIPTASADEIVAIAAKRYSRAGFTRVDAHTIECPVRRVTYVPIPPGPSINHTGLLTIDLPMGVRKGQQFDVSVRQVRRVGKEIVPRQGDAGEKRLLAQAGGRLDWRYTLGAFQIRIPVKTKETMLVDEERLLALVKWILLSIPTHDRWYQVFRRYVDVIIGRVRALGGDPEKVPPSPTWVPKPLPHPHPGHGAEAKLEATGKIAGLVFDHFGDFEGFILETEESERTYKSREAEIKQLAERAWAERLRITVISERDEPHRPLRIIVRQPPAPFRG